jgi:muramoyltetrapeptide carboxypeptidase
MNTESFKRGCVALQNLGYKPFFFDTIFDRDLYFAGSAEQRARDLEAMFERNDIAAILCARGGYGANYLLPLLDIDKIRKHAKPFIGYSDVTSLLTYFADQGLVTFHGPMVASDFCREGQVDVKAWRKVLGGEEWNVRFNQRSEVHGIAEGAAEGTLYGGCLSMLAASLGTPYEVHTDNTILFMEDLAAKPYQVDRMLMQLKLAGKLRNVRGIIFGEMLECVQPGSTSYSLEEIVTRVVGDVGVPVAYGLRSGHVSGGNIVLPIGVKARLSVSKKMVKLQVDAATVTHR